MNSKSPAHPEGIGASSGALGRYVMDHSAGNVYFYLPDVQDTGGPYELLGSDSIMIPRYQNLGSRREPYLRGFGLWGGIQRLPVPSFLRRHPEVAFGFLCARSETLPHRDNRIEIDPDLRDRWGIPAAHIVCEWKDEDRVLAGAARQAATEIVEAAGGKCTEVTELFLHTLRQGTHRKMQKGVDPLHAGMFVHEVGGTDGDRRATSVLDPHCRCWRWKNLFVPMGPAGPLRLAESDADRDGDHRACLRPRRPGAPLGVAVTPRQLAASADRASRTAAGTRGGTPAPWRASHAQGRRHRRMRAGRAENSG
jgi:hypothetical protein